jgi:serine/threonine-protein kinase
MALSTPCPDPKSLRLYNLGSLDEPAAEQLERHVIACTDCLARLDQAPTCEPLLRALGARLAPAEAPKNLSTLIDLMERLCRLPIPGGESTGVATGEGIQSTVEHVLPADVPAAIGRYQVLERVGAGGMGVVYKAQDRDLDRLVAVKVPHFNGPPDVQARAYQRFLREARAAARVQHPHVCTIHDVGEDGNRPYVVMEFVLGESLAARLHRLGRYGDCRQAVSLVVQIAAALQAVHACGIIHRDLKPGNILLRPDGSALLTDFGLARLLDDPEHLTQEGVLLGTVAYMAPELMDPAGGAQASCGSDVYSLGVILYRMLTGQLPFTGSHLALVRQIADLSPPRPSSHRDDIDPALEAIILRAMARQPEDRYPSGEALELALRWWLDSSWPVVPGDASGSNGRAVSVAAGTARRGSGRGRVRGRHLVFATACLILVLGIWAGLALIWPGPPALTGSLWVRYWQPRKGLIHDKEHRANVALALPLQKQDMIRVDARMSRAAYLYVLGVDRAGQVLPLYPWEGGEWKRRPREERPTARWSLPPRDAPDGRFAGLEIDEGNDGMTLVLLARETPLPERVDLEKLLMGFPVQCQLNLQADMLLDFDRQPEGPQRGRLFSLEPRPVDDALTQTQVFLDRHLTREFPHIHIVVCTKEGQ